MKRNLILSWLAVMTLFLMALPVRAADPVEVSLTANANELTVGDPVELILSVTHPPDYQPIMPKLEPLWGEFEVRAQSPVEVIEKGDGTLITQQAIEVTLFSPGTFQTPPLLLSISDGQGNLVEALAAPVSLTVVPTLSEGNADLIDIRPQAEMALPAPWPLMASGLIAVAGLGWIGWWLYRRRAAQAIDNRPPYQVALDELARIEGLNLPAQGRYKELYTLVTDCLRLYLEKQHRVRAFDRTTPELKQSLAESNIERATTAAFIDLFTEGDMVKFAKFTPQAPAAKQATLAARALVEATQPRPEPEEEAAGPPSPPTNAPQKRERVPVLEPVVGSQPSPGGQPPTVALKERS